MTKHAIVEKIKAAKVALAAEAKEALYEHTKAFFAAVPECASIVWEQYTPYFNDGETCEFGVHEPTFRPELQAMHEPDVRANFADDGDFEADYNDLTGAIRKVTEPCWRNKNKTDRGLTEREAEILKHCDSFSKLISGLGDYMQDIFGDHVQVTASATGFDVAEYDHD